MRYFVQLLKLLLGLLFLVGSGCATYQNKVASITATWKAGNAAAAADKFAGKARKSGDSDAVIWNLEAGTAYRAAGDFTNSNHYLDRAAAAIQSFDAQAKVKLSDTAITTLSNRQSMPYKGKSYDRIMLHTYKALNYLALGETEKARPEIIRAYQYQQDAVEENTRRIEKAQAEQSKAEEKERVDRAKKDPKVVSAMERVNSDIEGFQPYADYVNPFTVYMDGLYFLYAGAGSSDLERAVKSLKRVTGANPQNRCLQADFATAQAMQSGVQPSARTYIIFETGSAASFGQVRIDVPIVFSDVSYVGAAIPTLIPHGGQTVYLQIRAGGSDAKTQRVASMDSVIALDFKNELPSIITKTIAATVSKAVATHAVNEAARHQSDALGLAARIGSTIVQSNMNIADTRSWTTLPKEFQVACVPTPETRKITLSAPGQSPQEIALIDGTINIVYVRSTTAGAPLLINQAKLK